VLDGGNLVRDCCCKAIHSLSQINVLLLEDHQLKWGHDCHDAQKKPIGYIAI